MILGYVDFVQLLEGGWAHGLGKSFRGEFLDVAFGHNFGGENCGKRKT
jgi:hypothetical protein